jgi:Cytochrome P450
MSGGTLGLSPYFPLPVSYSQMDQKTYWAAFAAGILFLAFIRRRSRTESHPPFPPGPPRDPIIGSLRSFPRTRWHEGFLKLQETYGDLIYFRLFGQSLLVVNSLEIAKDLAEKRGNIYSRRPQDNMSFRVYVFVSM